jgi:hypothetical protein
MAKLQQLGQAMKCKQHGFQAAVLLCGTKLNFFELQRHR